MARFETRRWVGDPAGLIRRDRRPCDYEIYLPDQLAGRTFSLDGEVAADVSDAEAALVRLNTSGPALAGAESKARLLLRAESVASSRIEGLVIGGRRLLRADAARQMGDDPGDVTAVEVLGNIDAMVWGVESVGPGEQITVEILLEVHRRLLAGTNIEEHAGRIRKVQNWIGGSSYNPCSAAFVPPPPESVSTLVEDLCAFCNEDSLPALAQAAIAHAQFETIHPFVDGNGRAGRALVHQVLRRRGYGLLVLPPVSIVLAARSMDYVNGLTGTRYDGAPDSDKARAGINRWIAFFSSACGQAAEHASRFDVEIRALQSSWRQRVGPARRDAAVYALIEALPAAPVLTVATAAELIGRSFQATGQGIRRLVEAGVLAQVNVGRRNRAFESPELIEAFNSLERRVANPQSD